PELPAPDFHPFFLRLQFATPAAISAQPLGSELAEAADRFAMTVSLQPAEKRTRTLMLLSKAAHCLYTLLFQQSSGQLPIDIVGVAGNHDSLAQIGRAHV